MENMSFSIISNEARVIPDIIEKKMTGKEYVGK